MFQNNYEKKFKKKYYKPRKTKGFFNNNYIEYESREDKHKNCSLEAFLDLIRPYLRDIMDNHKNNEEWKIQLTMQVTLILSTQENFV